MVQRVFKRTFIFGFTDIGSLCLGRLGLVEVDQCTIPITALSPAVQIEIPPGTQQQIGQKLGAVGLICSTTAWDLWARWLQSQDSKGEFKAWALPVVAHSISCL